MKTYIAIGHWDYSKNITCVVSDADTRKEFEHDLKGNGFIAWVIFSEKKLSEYKAADFIERMDMVSYRNRHAMDIRDYLDECMDIIENKLAAC